MVSKSENIYFNGYILAGGKSSRMGIDKGLMLLEGKAIIQYVMEQLEPMVNELVIVSNNPEYEKFGLKVIPDRIKDIGPAGGIHSALTHTNTSRCFIVSCDIPFVTTRAIHFIRQQSENYQIALPVYKGKIQTLLGVYSKSCLLVWQRLINEGIFKLQDLILHFKLNLMEVENNDIFNERMFFNINDRNEFEAALKQL